MNEIPVLPRGGEHRAICFLERRNIGLFLPKGFQVGSGDFANRGAVAKFDRVTRGAETKDVAGHVQPSPVLAYRRNEFPAVETAYVLFPGRLKTYFRSKARNGLTGTGHEIERLCSSLTGCGRLNGGGVHGGKISRVAGV